VASAAGVEEEVLAVVVPQGAALAVAAAEAGSLHSITRRLFRIRRSLQIFGPMNFGFHKVWEKRFESEFDHPEWLVRT
jgi:hypothetical protein